jgi:hypothetical protein
MTIIMMIINEAVPITEIKSDIDDSLLLILKAVVFVLYIFFCSWLHTFRSGLFLETGASTRTLVTAC